MKAQAKEAKKLSKLLGEDHDLAVLADATPRLTRSGELHAADRQAPRRAARSARAARAAHLRRAPEGVRAPLPALRGPGRGLMGLEVERKFVLAERPDGLDGHPARRIEQGYLAIDPAGAEVRVRRKDAKTLMTVKIRDRARARRGGDRDRRRALRAAVAADRGAAGGQDALPRPARRRPDGRGRRLRGRARGPAHRRGRVRRRGGRARLRSRPRGSGATSPATSATPTARSRSTGSRASAPARSGARGSR